MSEAWVVAGEGSIRRRVPVGSSLVIGRGARCGLVLRDSLASRRHLEISEANGAFTCRDLGSRNGTKVNGNPTTVCELHDGDRIVVGQTVLRFESGARRAGTVPEKTVFMRTVLDPAGEVQEAPPATRSQELLEAAYTLLNALSSNFNPCELSDTILQTTMHAIQGQRGAILFGGPDQELLPCSVCGAVHTIRDGQAGSAAVDDIEISESVARRVLRDGENVLFQSVRAGSEVPVDVPTPSISALNLTSILCVPIRSQNENLGILYIDTDLAEHSYTQDDLLLAAAAGNSAGLALENARIHQSLLEKHRIEQEIAAAWTIQEGFLVDDWPEDDPRYQVYGETRPAKTVGGDFYDFVRLDDDTVGLLIGDVSGKGVPAALTMAQLIAEFRLWAKQASSPAEVLTALNERLVARSRRGTFCSMCYVTVELGSGRIVAANAGHHPLLRVSRDGVESLFDASGPPTGILPEGDWRNETGDLRRGDTLLLYTDGIVEARSSVTEAAEEAAPVEYRLEGLERVAAEHHACSPRQLIGTVVEDVHRFCSPLSPHDDCTMIALRFRGDGE